MSAFINSNSYGVFMIDDVKVMVDKNGVFVNGVKLPSVRSVKFAMEPDNVAVVDIRLYPSKVELNGVSVRIKDECNKPNPPLCDNN